MTDLTDDELRAACEAAGLLYLGTGVYSLPSAPEKGQFSYSWYPSDPALPAYVASLLVERVREMTHEVCTIDGAPTCDMTRVIIRTDPAAPAWVTLAEVSGRNADAQRIRAAMAVLEGEQ